MEPTFLFFYSIFRHLTEDNFVFRIESKKIVVGEVIVAKAIGILILYYTLEKSVLLLID